MAFMNRLFFMFSLLLPGHSYPRFFLNLSHILYLGLSVSHSSVSFLTFVLNTNKN